MYIFAPISQVSWTVIAGILMDKFGKPKHIFAGNMAVFILILVSILLIPSANQESYCDSKPYNMQCISENGTSLEVLLSVENQTTLCDSYINLCSEYYTNINYSEADDNYIQTKIPSRYLESLRNSSSFSDVGDSSIPILCNYDMTDIKWNYEVLVACNISCEQETCPEPMISRKGWVLIYGFLFIAFLTTYTVPYRIMDVMIMSMIFQHGGDYGQTRFFCILGDMVVAALAGYLVDLTTNDVHYQTYGTAIYISISLSVLVTVLVYTLDVTVKVSHEKMGRKTLQLLRNPDAVYFVIVLMVLGTSWNFNASYNAWFLETFNASGLLIGLQSTVSSLYGLPFLFVSRYIIRKLGYFTIIVAAQFLCSVNFTCFSFLTDPWMSLAIISTQSVSYYLLWVVVIEYSNQIAPDGIKASIISLAGGIHYSFSKSIMGLTGGQILSTYGERTAYRFMAIFSLTGGIISTCYYGTRHWWTRRRHRTEFKEKEDDGKPNEETHER